MSKRSPAANGTHGLDDYMRPRDTRTKWQAVKDAIYNPTDGTFCGRTKKRWGIVGVFYLVFYSVLALLCAVCYMGLMATIDEHRPTYTMEESIIGVNPGMGFRPLRNEAQVSLIEYSNTNATAIKEWVKLLDDFFEKYNNKSMLLQGGRTQTICDYGKPPQEGKVCAVNMDDWKACSSAEGYGFKSSSPCIFVKLNKIIDWKPDYYNDPENLPDEMPEDLKEHIKGIDKSKLNTVWVSCKGEKPADTKNMGELEYFPSYRGFPGYYYPFTNSPEYLSPVVAVHFKRPTRNILINIECRVWAKNIFYSTKGGEKAGAVHFELKINDKIMEKALGNSTTVDDSKKDKRTVTSLGGGAALNQLSGAHV